MAQKKRERNSDKQINKMFERQQRQLNRKWFRNAIGGVVLLAAVWIALQFTPYRNIHRDVIRVAKSVIGKLTSGPAAPAEPNPKYW